jgi:hypothetical protein
MTHDALTSEHLAAGFEHQGVRYPLVNPRRGIFKPKEMRFLLSIRTVAHSVILMQGQHRVPPIAARHDPVHGVLILASESVEYLGQCWRQTLPSSGVAAHSLRPL